MNSVDRTDTMRRARILRWASLSAALAACAATLAAVSLTGWSLFQPDTRYMVAIGRWIVENGELPTSDPLTLHEGLAYICQQWPLCIAAAASFDACGEAGIKCIGVDEWQGDVDPCVFWSALKDIDGAIYKTGKDFLAGNFTAGRVEFGIKTDSRVYDQRDFDKLPAELQTEVSQLVEDIKTGKVDVFSK